MAAQAYSEGLLGTTADPIRMAFNFPFESERALFRATIARWLFGAAVVKLPVLVMAVVLAVKLKRAGL